MDIPSVARAAGDQIGTTWSEFHLFSLEELTLSIPTSTEPISIETCNSLSKLFTSAEYAIRAGIVLGDKSYAVHQCETNPNIDLVYGRTGDAVSGSGACVARVKNADGDEVYAAIAYEFPSLSANAVPELVDLLDRHLKMTGNIASTSSNVGNA